MAGNITQKVELYKRLDDRRAGAGLSPEEEELWADLRADLELVSSPSEEIPPSSRRFAVRVPANLGVTFTDARGFNKAYLRNISEGGVYVETTLSFEMGNRFELEIQVQRPAKTLELSVEVVWVNRSPSESSGLKCGVGVAFLDLAPDHKKEIKALIHHALDVMVDSSAEPAVPADASEPVDGAPRGDEPEPSTKRLPRDDQEGEAELEEEPEPSTVWVVSDDSSASE